jgi:hypothetical protein
VDRDAKGDQRCGCEGLRDRARQLVGVHVQHPAAMTHGQSNSRSVTHCDCDSNAQSASALTPSLSASRGTLASCHSAGCGTIETL